MNQGDFAGFDHHDPTLDGEERYRRYAELRTCPVGRSEAHGGFSIVARHAEVEAACKDWATFSSGNGVFLPDITAGARSAGLEQDPPDHGPVRQLFVEMLGRPLVRAA